MGYGRTARELQCQLRRLVRADQQGGTTQPMDPFECFGQFAADNGTTRIRQTLRNALTGNRQYRRIRKWWLRQTR